MTTFMRGLTLGALVGAAIAGSAIWQRGRRGRQTVRSDETRAPPEQGREPIRTTSPVGNR